MLRVPAGLTTWLSWGAMDVHESWPHIRGQFSLSAEPHPRHLVAPPGNVESCAVAGTTFAVFRGARRLARESGGCRCRITTRRGGLVADYNRHKERVLRAIYERMFRAQGILR